jgi:hypothetical protein
LVKEEHAIFSIVDVIDTLKFGLGVIDKFASDDYY